MKLAKVIIIVVEIYPGWRNASDTCTSISFCFLASKSWAIKRTLRCFRMQWLAVSTHLAAIKVPPQNTSF